MTLMDRGNFVDIFKSWSYTNFDTQGGLLSINAFYDQHLLVDLELKLILIDKHLK